MEREETRWLCLTGHSFDRAAAGYVNLLPANRKHSKDPGDDKDMVAARAAFLDKAVRIFCLMKPFNDYLNEALADFQMPER